MTVLVRLGEDERGRRLPTVAERFRPLIADSPRLVGWLGPIGVALFAFVLRVIRLGVPDRLAFDETYYAKDAYSLTQFGYAQDYIEDANKKILAGQLHHLWTGQPTEIVHPDGAKWIIAIGEHLFGMDAFGWRISSVVIGALTVLVLARLVRRLTGSTMLGCLAGFLLAIDGLHFVMSRLALLDVFLAFWLVCAVACLVADRDWGRVRLARRYPISERITGFGPVRMLLLRPWRLLAGVCFGMACATKWNGIYVLAAFGILTVVWDARARHAIGVRSAWIKSVLVDAIPAFVSLVIVALIVYVASWTGWLIHHEAFEARFAYSGDKPWGSYLKHPAKGGLGEFWVALQSLWHFHVMVYDFHTGSYLAGKTHPYMSNPQGWLLLGRTVGVDAQNDIPRTAAGCHAAAGDTCMRQVLILGNPVIWWTGVLALIASVWAWIKDRDWRYAVPLLAVVATWLPWFQYDDRPIFLFYATATIPFTVIAIVLIIGRLLGPEVRRSPLRRRRWVVIGVGLWVAVAAACFAYFYPIYADVLITHTQWTHRMWFSKWV